MGKQSLKIGIMGVGFVGGALLQYFKRVKKLKPLVYDKYKRLGSVEQINQADIVFICVPTPFKSKSGFNLSFVKDAMKSLEGQKNVVIKSSIIPGTTETLQKLFPQHRVLFNPEFLRQASAYRDTIHPERQILGVTRKSIGVAAAIMKQLPKAPYEKIMPSGEAETVKYMGNSFLALKVVFANEFYDLCGRLGLNYERVSEAVAKDSRIGTSHLNIKAGGYRGYGGRCLPKDVNSIIELAESKKVRLELLRSMRRLNQKLLKQSGLNENYFFKELHKKK